MYDETLTLRVGEESCKFDLYQGIKHPFKNDFCMRVDVVDDYMNKVQRGRLAKSCDSEDIEKCLQVHSSEEEGFLKHQNPMTQCKLPLNRKPIPPSIEKSPSNSLI